ncbi:MAG TPA: hypothetical protein PLG65_03210 [Bacillota bacterium]|nr:hypothetical protein [Bacillota bacterium]
MDVILVAGTPGDVHGLVRPVAERVATAMSVADAWVFIPPSSHAGGREAKVASSYLGVRRAVGPLESLKYLAAGVAPRGFARCGKGVVIHLGGDLIYSVGLGRRLRYPVFAYTGRAMSGAKSVSLFLVEDERVQASLIARGVDAERIKLVGNLIIDGVGVRPGREEARVRLGIEQHGRSVMLFPGLSRREVSVTAPFLFRAAELLARVEQEVSFTMCLPPFVGTASLEQLFAHTRYAARIDGAAARVEKSAGPLEAVTAEGVRIRIETVLMYEAMAASDIAVCTPGPVCAELAYLGVPHVVTAPLNVPGAVAVPGVSPLLCSLPFIGEAFQRRAVDRLKASSRFVSSVNQRAGRIIAPEIVGRVRPEDVVIPCVELLGEAARRDKMSKELREAAGLAGAADRVVQAIQRVALSQQ